MRRLVAGLVSSVAAVGFVACFIDVAHASTDCQRTDPATGVCIVWVEVPGNPGDPGDPGDGPKDTGSGKSCWWDGRPQGILKPPPGPVPCTSDSGYWSNSYQCYVRLLDPQPPADDPGWQGHTPGDGAVYHCYQPQTDLLIHIWSADPPPNSGAGPTPREVAQIAVEHMNLRAIEIGIAPKPGDGSVGLIGMPVWMWAASPDEHTVGPVTATASSGGITITATARLHKLTWDMGDGTKVTCTSAGTPYKPSFGNKKSPDCGHVYTTSSAAKPGRKFTVSATSDWVIEWDGAGQTGVIRLGGLVRETQIAIGEAQVLVQ